MTDTWEVIQDALSDANITGHPLIVGVEDVPSGLTARWSSLGQRIVVDPQGGVQPEAEDFEVSLWLPANADEAVTKYREITTGLTNLLNVLFAEPRVSAIEIQEDGFDGDVSTPDVKTGVLVRTITATVQP